MSDTISLTSTNPSFPPSDWVETTLGEVSISKQYGYTESASDEKIGPKFLRITDIQDDFINWDTVPYCPISDSDYKKYKLEIGDIVIARTGNSTGATAVIKKNIDGVFASYLIRFKLNPEKANYNFIDFLLRSDFWRGFVKSIKGGSAQGGANANNFAEFPILLPPLPEQQAIASVLSAFDDKIELLREQNKTLEEIGQTIFKEWFGKYSVDRPEELPKGWRVGKLGEICNLKSGFAFSSDDFVENGKYRLVTIANVQDGSFVEQTKDGLDKIPQKMPDYCKLKTGDILLSLTGNVGRICHVIGENYFLNQRVAKLQAKEKQDYGFIYKMFKQKSMIGLLESISAGTAQQNLSPIKTADLEIIIPTREILDEFAKSINPMIDKMLDNKIQIQSLARTRDTLLPKLMRGEVRVKF